MFGEATFASRGEGPSSYARAVAPSKAAFLTCLTFYGIVFRESGIRAVELLAERLSFYEQRTADIALEKVPARLASRHIVVEDTELLQRIAEDTA